jgi:transcription-repair coupling factor (superfamily II helicase)
MSEIAEKRLRAISEFTELGAGFKIAMRDLEIRGAGNLLGSQQHGHIAGVGFEMYCRLLEEAVRELKEGPLSEPAPEPVLELSIDAYIPGEYVDDAMHKIELYSQVAAIRSEEQASEFLDEIIDRFGEPPEPLKNLLLVARIKNMARRMGVRSIIQKLDSVEITFSDQPAINVEGLMEMRSKNPNRIQINPGPPQSIRLRQGTAKQPLPDWLLTMFKRMLPEATP